MSKRTDINLAAAYRHCAQLATEHPFFDAVCSVVSDKRHRTLIPVFAFVTTARSLAGRDDAADALEDLEDSLRDCYRDQASEPLFVALLDVVDQGSIPITPFLEIIDGYRIHAAWDRFTSYQELSAYLARTVEPIARLIAFMIGIQDARVHRYIEEFCCALGEVSMWEHAHTDACEGRVYLPEQDLYHFEVSVDDLYNSAPTPGMLDLMRFVAMRARSRFERARPMLRRLDRDDAERLEVIWNDGVARLQVIIDANEPNYFGRRQAASPSQVSDPIAALAPFTVLRGAV